MIIKAIFDRLFSLIFMIIVAPVLMIIAIWIKLDSKGRVFFVQERVGRDGQLFRIYKFRTMIPNAIHTGLGVLTEENDPRITKAGHFLRKTSLDELPQIFNILRGDMSFIGPRPTLEYQVKQYDEFQMKRLRMKPGVTGLAQVNGRNSISWPERIKYDVQYVENWSLGLDLKIIVKTFGVIFKQEGLYGDKDKFIIRNDKKDGQEPENENI
jgi:exopolysaccharide biosynthesis polyprenyl glycosylphosphotransferase